MTLVKKACYFIRKLNYKRAKLKISSRKATAVPKAVFLRLIQRIKEWKLSTFKPSLASKELNQKT